jgi:hypothetical protein
MFLDDIYKYIYFTLSATKRIMNSLTRSFKVPKKAKINDISPAFTTVDSELERDIWA